MRGDEHIFDVAASQRYLLSRPQALEAGMTQKAIDHRVSTGRWLHIHDGVYQIDRRPLSWDSKLLAAVLAGGPDARVSHRAAMVLWDMDGITSAPLEITMPFGNLAFPEEVIAHRSRRPTPRAERRGIPVSGPERTLLECSRYLGPLTMGKALDSAIRGKHTTVDRVWLMLANEGGRGVHGTRLLKAVLRERVHDTATDSGAEYELLYHMQKAGLPTPILGFELQTKSGRRVGDLVWPDRGKGVEVDGIDAHSSADKLDDDLVRQNEMMDLGLEIRRFSARRIRREPEKVVEEIRQFLEA